jgi:hypothetical protein
MYVRDDLRLRTAIGKYRASRQVVKHRHAARVSVQPVMLVRPDRHIRMSAIFLNTHISCLAEAGTKNMGVRERAWYGRSDKGAMRSAKTRQEREQETFTVVVVASLCCHLS